MKHALTTFMMMLSLSCLSAQTISNVRVSQHPELRYYQITFDLSGKADELYQIKAVPYKGGRELSNLRYLSGQGITQPCSPGKDLQIFWAADLDGFETEGWEFRLTPAALPKNMVFVQGGTFQMGSNDGDSNEKPVHPVTVSSFWICKYELTLGEFREFINDTGYMTDVERKGGAFVWTGSDVERKSDANWRNPYFTQNDRHPATCLSWFDALTYCNWRSRRESLQPVYSIEGDTWPKNWSEGEINCDWNANGYRLPTEAEWEYAARGRTNNPDYLFSGSDDINAVAWYWDNNSPYGSKPVGTKAPNGIGTYDMSGNVWEWCWDWYDEDYYSRSLEFDPRGADSGLYRLLRGGSWNYGDYSCQVAYRSGPDDWNDNNGFRLVRSIL